MFDLYLKELAEAQSTDMVYDIQVKIEMAVQMQSITVEEYSRLILIADIAFRANMWMESAYEAVGMKNCTTP